MTKYRRHGDVGLFPLSSLPKGKVEKHNGSFVLALGETTGHKHVITVEREDAMTIVTTDEGRFIELKMPGTLTHEEHGTITVEPGIYFQVAEREMDWFGLSVKKVID